MMLEKMRTYGLGAGDFAAILWVGLIVAVFIAGLLLSVLTGDINKLKRAIKSQTSAKKPRSRRRPYALPKKADELLRLTRSAGVRAGDAFTDAAVRLPYYKGWASKFAPSVLLVSVCAGATAFALFNEFTLYSTLAAGAAFSAAALTFQILYYKNALKLCKKYLSVQNALYDAEKNAAPSEESEELCGEDDSPFVFETESGDEKRNGLFEVELEGND